MYIIWLVFHYLIFKEPILLVFYMKKILQKLNSCCIFSELFCFNVTTTEILSAQFLYARYREFVAVIFVLTSNLQTDQMSGGRAGRWGCRSPGQELTEIHFCLTEGY